MELDVVRLQNLATALTQDKQALANKGVSVPEGALHDDIPGLIGQIQKLYREEWSFTLQTDGFEIDIECPHAKAVVIQAEAQASELPANSLVNIRASGMNDDGNHALGIATRWDGTQYKMATISPLFAEDCVTITSAYPFAAGVKYNCWAYGWETEESQAQLLSALTLLETDIPGEAREEEIT